MHEDSKSGTSDVLMLLGNHSGPHQRDVAREMLPSAFYTNSQLLATIAIIAILSIPMLSRSSLCPLLYFQTVQQCTATCSSTNTLQVPQMCCMQGLFYRNHLCVQCPVYAILCKCSTHDFQPPTAHRHCPPHESTHLRARNTRARTPHSHADTQTAGLRTCSVSINACVKHTSHCGT